MSFSLSQSVSMVLSTLKYIYFMNKLYFCIYFLHCATFTMTFKVTKDYSERTYLHYAIWLEASQCHPPSPFFSLGGLEYISLEPNMNVY